jgi:hypothetical protein
MFSKNFHKYSFSIIFTCFEITNRLNGLVMNTNKPNSKDVTKIFALSITWKKQII